MSTIVKRIEKGSELTYEEMDANFENLNNDKIEASNSNTFSAPQRTSITTEDDNAIDFTVNNNFLITATSGNITVDTVAGCTGQSGVIVIESAENITGWGSEFVFKNIPSDLSDKETFAYFVQDESTIIIGRIE